MTIPTEMQAWILKFGQSEPVRTKLPVPNPAADGVLVKVLAMGVCHSDCTLLKLKEPLPNSEPEFVLGHEGAGEIVLLGDKVDKSEYHVGDRVAVHIIPGCDDSACPQCNRGWERLCRAKTSGNYGLGRDGVFAEYVAIQSRAAIKLPDGVDMVPGAVSGDAVLTAYHAMKYTAAVKSGQTIAIFGLGGLGLNALQTALHLGVKRVLVVDKRKETVDEAVKLGVASEDAFCTSDPDSKPIQQVVAEREIIVDTVIDFAGHEQTVLSAQLTVRPAGLLVMVGLLSQQVPIIPLVVVGRALTIQGSYSGSIPAFHECLELMAKGVLRPSIETGSIEDLPKVLKDLDDGKIKSRMVLLPDWKS